METAIFVGGPLHGQLRNVREGEWTVVAAESLPISLFAADPYDPVAPDEAFRKVHYSRARFMIFGRELLAYVVDGRRYDLRTHDALLDLILTPEAKGALR